MFSKSPLLGVVNVSRAAVACALITSANVSPARAEPITASYLIQLTERLSFANGVWTTEPLNEQLALRLTIDPDRASESQQYGPASFSPVPFETLAPPEGLLPLSTDSHTVHWVIDLFPYPSRTGAYADEGTDIVSVYQPTPMHYHRGIGIWAYGWSEVPPMLNAETFLMSLGGSNGGPADFRYLNWRCVGRTDYETCFEPGFPGGTWLQYNGTSVFQEIESPVVPEPTTIALVGGGLLMFARRLRTRAKSEIRRS
jgi:hypothetical protein